MSIFDKIGSTLVQTGTSLINNAFSQHNANVQRDWQEKMMDKANAYNTPLAQALRMRSAGLNPYQDMGAVPSASAGTGATAQTIPLNDPLAGAFTLAQIRNMDAQTGKTETETEKYLREITNLELLYQKGLIEKDEMEFRLEELKKAWKNKSQYTAELEQTEAETAQANSATALNNANQDLSSKQAQYVDLQQRIAGEQNELKKKALIEEANALRASAVQSYTNSLLASANTAKVNNDIQLANNEEARRVAIHQLETARKEAENKGILDDNRRKELENYILRVKTGDVRTLNDVGVWMQEFLTELIPF